MIQKLSRTSLEMFYRRTRDFFSRWTVYCSEVYDLESYIDDAVLVCSQPQEEIEEG